MVKVSNFVRRIFRNGTSKHDAVHDKLRRAVAHAKARHVAELLASGASPVWRSDRAPPHELNALLLACQRGDADILTLLLDWFFHDRAQLVVFGPQMYCLAIRNGHWHAFLRLYERNVPQVREDDSANSYDPNPTAVLPLPVFIAAESGQPQILVFLMRHEPFTWQTYTFCGHSLLSIASKHGHYRCVEALLSAYVAPPDAMEFAVDCARRHRQAHVLVLLTSCLPEYNAPQEDDRLSDGSATRERDSGSLLYKPPYASGFADDATTAATVAMLMRGPRHGSLAATDVTSDYGDEHNNSDSDDAERRSSAWTRASLDPVLGDAMPFSGNSDEAAYVRRTLDGYAILDDARAAAAASSSKSSQTDSYKSVGSSSHPNHSSSGELTWSSSSSVPLSGTDLDAKVVDIDMDDSDARWAALLSNAPPTAVWSNSSSVSNASTDPFTDFDGTFGDQDDKLDTKKGDNVVDDSRMDESHVAQVPEQVPEQTGRYMNANTSTAAAAATATYEPNQKQMDETPYAPETESLYQVPTPMPPVSHKLISIRTSSSSNFRSYRTLPSITEERQTMIERERS